MDGNGRWAEQRGLPRDAGHRAGVAAARRTIEASRELGVQILTMYAFSTENWRRPADEVEALMQLFEEAVQREAPDLIRNGVQLRVSGDLQSIEPGLRGHVERVMADTAANHDLILNFAFNYGGRAELVHAMRQFATDLAAGTATPDMIDEPQISRRLYTGALPDPDLLIRTGGEQRISNFLLWQLAYTELYFCDVFWPDFSKADLIAALSIYQARRRRFGGVEGT
jgi:undecaprenyl diphosphate synthase